MYKYELINNHYIINFDGYRLLLDTGCPYSFRINPSCPDLTIDGVTYRLAPKDPSLDVERTRQLVGISVDGFIGLDIISRTSLTIYKNGDIDFKAHDIDGKAVNLNGYGFLSILVTSNSMRGMCLIDTGAKYGYGHPNLFNSLRPYAHVSDYNPRLGDLDSDIYHLEVDIDGMKREVDVCNNPRVPTNSFGMLMITNITTFFDEVCVFDIRNNRLILK